MTRMRKMISLLCISTLIFVFCGSVARAQSDNETQTNQAKGRVLFISSYSYGWSTVQLQIEGIKAGLGEETVLDYEFMDTKRVDDEISEQQFLEGLQYRLSKVDAYDVVILGDDAALHFAMKYQKELFDGIPLVFEGINDEELVLKASEDPMITGVIEKLSVENNIELGRRLYPNAEKVVAILDDSITGEAERKSFYSYAEYYPEMEFSEINASQLTSDKLRQRFNQVGTSSILIYITMTEDLSGRQYSDSEAIALITQYTRVPVFRMVEAGIGNGLIGGNVVSMYSSGEIAAGMAMDIIGGKDCSEINAILESPNIYCVDELVMKKFELDMTRLPEGTTIVNHQPNFWERNEEALLPGGIIIVAFLVVIGVVTYDNIKRRKLLLELEEARGIMESASLHDFLTGLPNRSKFMEDLGNCISQKTPCTLLMLDIDDFKKINDNYGHNGGDDALRELAGRLKAMQSQILTAYRYAGDEFIIILKSAQSGLVEKTALQCRQMFFKSFSIAGKTMKICGSIGVASYPKHAGDAEHLISCADDAMYQVKKSGKNDYAIYQVPS